MIADMGAGGMHLDRWTAALRRETSHEPRACSQSGSVCKQTKRSHAIHLSEARDPIQRVNPDWTAFRSFYHYFGYSFRPFGISWFLQLFLPSLQTFVVVQARLVDSPVSVRNASKAVHISGSPQVEEDSRYSTGDGKRKFGIDISYRQCWLCVFVTVCFG
jgi:hypothetical protein